MEKIRSFSNFHVGTTTVEGGVIVQATEFEFLLSIHEEVGRSV